MLIIKKIKQTKNIFIVVSAGDDETEITVTRKQSYNLLKNYQF